MKKNLLLLVALVLVLPLVLGACSASATKNAENFVKAMADNDTKKAEKYICDDFKDAFKAMSEADTAGEKTKVTDLKCEEKDSKVTCKFKSDGESTELTFVMKDKKVCGFDFGLE